MESESKSKIVIDSTDKDGLYSALYLTNDTHIRLNGKTYSSIENYILSYLVSDEQNKSIIRTIGDRYPNYMNIDCANTIAQQVNSINTLTRNHVDPSAIQETVRSEYITKLMTVLAMIYTEHISEISTLFTEYYTSINDDAFKKTLIETGNCILKYENAGGNIPLVVCTELEKALMYVRHIYNKTMDDKNIELLNIEFRLIQYKYKLLIDYAIKELKKGANSFHDEYYTRNIDINSLLTHCGIPIPTLTQNINMNSEWIYNGVEKYAHYRNTSDLFDHLRYDYKDEYNSMVDITLRRMLLTSFCKKYSKPFPASINMHSDLVNKLYNSWTKDYNTKLKLPEVDENSITKFQEEHPIIQMDGVPAHLVRIQFKQLLLRAVCNRDQRPLIDISGNEKLVSELCDAWLKGDRNSLQFHANDTILISSFQQQHSGSLKVEELVDGKEDLVQSSSADEVRQPHSTTNTCSTHRIIRDVGNVHTNGILYVYRRMIIKLVLSISKLRRDCKLNGVDIVGKSHSYTRFSENAKQMSVPIVNLDEYTKVDEMTDLKSMTTILNNLKNELIFETMFVYTYDIMIELCKQDGYKALILSFGKKNKVEIDYIQHNIMYVGMYKSDSENKGNLYGKILTFLHDNIFASSDLTTVISKSTYSSNIQAQIDHTTTQQHAREWITQCLTAMISTVNSIIDFNIGLGKKYTNNELLKFTQSILETLFGKYIGSSVESKELYLALNMRIPNEYTKVFRKNNAFKYFNKVHTRGTIPEPIATQEQSGSIVNNVLFNLNTDVSILKSYNEIYRKFVAIRPDWYKYNFNNYELSIMLRTFFHENFEQRLEPKNDEKKEELSKSISYTAPSSGGRRTSIINSWNDLLLHLVPARSADAWVADRTRIYSKWLKMVLIIMVKEKVRPQPIVIDPYSPLASGWNELITNIHTTIRDRIREKKMIRLNRRDVDESVSYHPDNIIKTVQQYFLEDVYEKDSIIMKYLITNNTRGINRDNIRKTLDVLITFYEIEPSMIIYIVYEIANIFDATVNNEPIIFKRIYETLYAGDHRGQKLNSFRLTQQGQKSVILNESLHNETLAIKRDLHANNDMFKYVILEVFGWSIKPNANLDKLDVDIFAMKRYIQSYAPRNMIVDTNTEIEKANEIKNKMVIDESLAKEKQRQEMNDFNDNIIAQYWKYIINMYMYMSSGNIHDQYDITKIFMKSRQHLDEIKDTGDKILSNALDNKVVTILLNILSILTKRDNIRGCITVKQIQRAMEIICSDIKQGRSTKSTKSTKSKERNVISRKTVSTENDDVTITMVEFDPNDGAQNSEIEIGGPEIIPYVYDTDVNGVNDVNDENDSDGDYDEYAGSEEDEQSGDEAPPKEEQKRGRYDIGDDDDGADFFFEGGSKRCSELSDEDKKRLYDKIVAISTSDIIDYENTVCNPISSVVDNITNLMKTDKFVMFKVNLFSFTK
jgi:hypothetical protein